MMLERVWWCSGSMDDVDSEGGNEGPGKDVVFYMTRGADRG